VVACSARENLITVAQQKLPNKYHVLPKKLFFHTSVFGVDACINSFTFGAPSFSASFSTPECGFFDTWTPKNSKLVTAFISVLLSRANCTQ
jgi:hypothetical protein